MKPDGEEKAAGRDAAVADLVGDVLHGGWSSADAAAANNMLVDGDVSTVVRWVERVQVDVELRRAFRPEGEEEQATRLAGLLAASSRRSRHRTPRRRNAAVFGAVVVASVAIAFAGLFTNVSRREPVVGSVVIASTGAIWGEADPPGVIRQGDRLSLEKGYATLEMLDGTRVELSAPVTAVARKRDSIGLVTGFARFTVPETAIGFTLVTDETEVVDLGTEFMAFRSEAGGTEVAVTRGVVAARPVSDGRAHGNTVRLGASREATFAAGEASEVQFRTSIDWPEFAGTMADVFGGIRRVEGIVKVGETTPFALGDGDYPTRDFILVIREATDLPARDFVDGASPDDRVDCYLVHFDPPSTSVAPPRGTVTFHQSILKIVTESEALLKLDEGLGTRSKFARGPHRGLELDETLDHCEVDADGRTVRFHLRRTGWPHLDQFRVFVRAGRSGPQAHEGAR